MKRRGFLASLLAIPSAVAATRKGSPDISSAPVVPPPTRDPVELAAVTIYDDDYDEISLAVRPTTRATLADAMNCPNCGAPAFSARAGCAYCMTRRV